MSDAHAVARDQLLAFITRIERLEEEKKSIADDIKDVKAEAKGCGFDVGTINAIIKLRKVDASERAERDALLDTYMIALGMLPEPADDYEREPGEALDGEVNAKLVATVATGMQTEIGRKALVKALDIMIEREEAGEFQAKASGDNGATEQDIEDTADSVTGDASRSSRGDDSPATHSEKAPVATHGEATEPTSVEREDCAAANAGGDHVDGNALRVPTSNTGEGAANTALPAKSRLRPNCLQPELCRSGTRDHCYSCRKAMEQEDAA